MPRLSSLARSRHPRAISLALASAAWGACALSALAADPAHTIDVSKALDAGALPRTLGDVTITQSPPDPTPLVERSQWVFDLRWDRGDVWLLDVAPLELPQARPTPRAMGRFALELFEGPILIERVRFDFPLLGVPERGDGGWSAPPTFGPKLKTRIGVVFPATRRGTRLELRDRATNRQWSLPWPLANDVVVADGGDAG